MIFSVHPRTRERLERLGLDRPPLRPCEPFGYFDFVALERDARCVLTDSGTVQEECCIMRVPAVTLRDTTERPETIECGSNVLSGSAAVASARRSRSPATRAQLAAPAPSTSRRRQHDRRGDRARAPAPGA